MKCETFEAWLEREGPAPPDRMPEEVAAHHRACPRCRALLEEELFWGRFFAAAPAVAPPGPMWPGVAAGIEKWMERAESFSSALVRVGLRLVPVFAVILLLLGAAAIWSGSALGPREPALSIASLADDPSARPGPPNEEPDTILDRWVGAAGE